MITSRANDRVKAIAALQQRKERARTGLSVAEGIRLVREALSSDLVIESLILAETFLTTEAAAATNASQAVKAHTTATTIMPHTPTQPQ